MDRREMERFLRAYAAELSRSAAQLQTQPMPPLTERAFARFEETGNRLEYEGIYFARRKFLAILGLEAILQSERKQAVDPALMTRLCQVVEEVCGEETWALPAHVDRSGCPDWRITVDLFAAETAQTLSELADRLFPLLPEPIFHRMVQEVARRVLQPFFRAEAPYSWWEGAGMNWNGVCAGAIGSACIHLHSRGISLPLDISRCLARIDRSLERYICGFPRDGACLEGLGYYTYGMSYYMNYLQEAEESLGRRPRLPDHFPAIAQFPQKCYFADGQAVSFSDGDSRERYRAGLLAALAQYAPGVRFPNPGSAAGVHTDGCYRFVQLKMDLFCTAQFLRCGVFPPEHGSPRERMSVFPDAQWCIAQSSGGVGFACKGGCNQESHNHNDIGHFLYEAGGTVFFPDLGAGEYTADYFGENRYHILCNSSAGHSVPAIGGGQMPGPDFRCGDFSVTTEGEILHVRMEIGSAYGGGTPLPPGAAVRVVAFHLGTGALEVTDRFDCALCGAVTENLITQVPPRRENGCVILERDGRTAVLRVDGAGVPPSIRIARLVHRNHQGVQEPVYAIAWDVGRGGVARFHVEIRSANS